MEDELDWHLTISIAFCSFYIVKIVLNFRSGHVRNYTHPEVTFDFCSHGEKLPPQDGLLDAENGLPASRSYARAMKKSCEQEQESDRTLRQS